MNHYFPEEKQNPMENIQNEQITHCLPSPHKGALLGMEKGCHFVLKEDILTWEKHCSYNLMELGSRCPGLNDSSS